MRETGCSLRYPIVAAAVFFSLCFTSVAAVADGGWTFCMASSLDSKDVWITEVFSATSERQQMEALLANLLRRQSAARVNAQCPLPREDKLTAINNRLVAEEFNRKLGSRLHAIAARDFP